MTYKLLDNGVGVVRAADNAVIPADPRNADWQAYQAWLAAGNAPDAADPLPAPAPSVSPRQVRLALTQLGLRDAVESYVAAASQDVKDSWDYATAFRRDNALIAAAAAALGKSGADIDALFALAATL